jgi:hypothetical protein
VPTGWSVVSALFPTPSSNSSSALMFTPGAISSVAMSAMAGAVMMRRVMRIASIVNSRSSAALSKLKRIAGGVSGRLDVT